MRNGRLSGKIRCLTITFLTMLLVSCSNESGTVPTSTSSESEMQKTSESSSEQAMEPTEQMQGPADDSELTPLAKRTDYGNLTQYLGKPASELIQKFGEEYQYEYGEGFYNTDTSGKMHFDPYVYFGFSESTEELDGSCQVSVITVVNPSKSMPSSDLGHCLNAEMTFAEIKGVMGDTLVYEPASVVFLGYRAYGLYQGCRYFFVWHDDPTTGDVLADYVSVSIGGLDWIASEAMQKELNDYCEKQKAGMEERKETYLTQLREKFTELPVHKFAYLTTLQIDEHNTLEIYESATYGRPATWETKGSENYKYTGVDRTKEVYDYNVFGRLLVDGKQVEILSFYQDGWHSENYVRNWLSFREGGASGVIEQVCQECGLPINKEPVAVTLAETRTWIIDDTWAMAVYACYLNDSDIPVFSERYQEYTHQNGGTDNKHIFLADGSELDLQTLKTVKKGTTKASGDSWPFGGRDLEWSLMESPSGVQVIYLYSNDFNDLGFAPDVDVYAYEYYLYVDQQVFFIDDYFIL